MFYAPFRAVCTCACVSAVLSVGRIRHGHDYQRLESCARRRNVDVQRYTGDDAGARTFLVFTAARQIRRCMILVRQCILRYCCTHRWRNNVTKKALRWTDSTKKDSRTTAADTLPCLRSFLYVNMRVLRWLFKANVGRGPNAADFCSFVWVGGVRGTSARQQLFMILATFMVVLAALSKTGRLPAPTEAYLLYEYT